MNKLNGAERSVRLLLFNERAFNEWHVPLDVIRFVKVVLFTDDKSNLHLFPFKRRCKYTRPS